MTPELCAALCVFALGCGVAAGFWWGYGYGFTRGYVLGRWRGKCG